MEIFSKIGRILLWPEIRIFWAIIALLIVIFVNAYGFLQGLEFWVHAASLAVLGVVVFFSVYTAARIERESSAEKNELQSTFFKIEDPLIAYDNDFKILLFNPAAEKLFKAEPGKVIGHRFHPQDVENPSWRLLTQVIFPSLAPSVTSRSRSGESPQVVDLSFTDPVLE